MKHNFFLTLAVIAWALSLTGGAFADGLKNLTPLDGTPASVDKAADAGKDKKLVVFWATWCDECRAKLRKGLPELNARKDVSVITVNTDKDEARVKEFVAKENISLPVFRDSTKELRKELKVFSVPHWAVYQKNKAGEYELVKSEPAFEFDHVMKALDEKSGGT